jgi:hypothetical protein
MLSSCELYNAASDAAHPPIRSHTGYRRFLAPSGCARYRVTTLISIQSHYWPAVTITRGHSRSFVRRLVLTANRVSYWSGNIAFGPQLAQGETSSFP